ncbi:unnamed protein product [Peronospora effusa]|nr:unnamed protein product [Peronospora effusa]
MDRTMTWSSAPKWLGSRRKWMEYWLIWEPNGFHFDTARRGFSVLHDGPIGHEVQSARCASSNGSAAVNRWTFSEVQLTKIFRDFGEEKLAKEFAKALLHVEREERGKVFETTRDLRESIERIANMWKSVKKGKNKKKKKSNRASKAGSTSSYTLFSSIADIRERRAQSRGTWRQETCEPLSSKWTTRDNCVPFVEDRPIKDFFRELDKHGRIKADEDDEWDDEDSDDEDEASAEEVATNSRSRSARLRCLERIG